MSEATKVTAAKYHTHQGKEYNVGDVYSVAPHELGNLVAQGMVAPLEAPAEPKAQRKSQPVAPMTTESFGVTPKPAAKPAAKPARTTTSRVTTGPKK